MSSEQVHSERGCLAFVYDPEKITSIQTFDDLRLQLPFQVSRIHLTDPYRWTVDYNEGETSAWIKAPREGKSGSLTGLTVVDIDDRHHDFVIGQVNEPGYTCVILTDPALSPDPTASTPLAHAHECGREFVFQQGMLYENLTRALTQCGYVLGRWDMGDDRYFVDYPVKNDFRLLLNQGIEDILNVVRDVYGIAGTTVEVSRTVDFYQLESGN